MRYRRKGDGVYVMLGAYDQISPDMAYSNDRSNAIRLMLFTNNMARLTFYDRPVETPDHILRHYGQKFEQVDFPLAEIERLPTLLTPFVERQRLQSILAPRYSPVPAGNSISEAQQAPIPVF